MLVRFDWLEGWTSFRDVWRCVPLLLSTALCADLVLIALMLKLSADSWDLRVSGVYSILVKLNLQFVEKLCHCLDYEHSYSPTCCSHGINCIIVAIVSTK